MKINKLFIKNIHSLAGEHVIDFDDINRSSDGVFLIVGPTGSGKTTLLDAITLGLFGSVKRLGDISNTNIEKNGSVVTRNENEAQVDVVFTIRQKQYTARWQIRRRKRAQGWEPAQMSLYDENLELVESGLNPVKKLIPEIIGMSADQFNKAILLAQGDFASFLRSKFEEKADILEKITGTEHYSRIGAAIFEKNKQLESQENLLRNQLEQIQILPEEIVRQLTEQHERLGLAEAAVYAGISQLVKRINDKKSYDENTVKLSEIRSKAGHIASKVATIMDQYGQRLLQWDIVKPRKALIENIRWLKDEIPGLTLQLDDLKNKKDHLEARERQLYEEAQPFFKVLPDGNNFTPLLKKLGEVVTGIDAKLNECKISLANAGKNMAASARKTGIDELVARLHNEMFDGLDPLILHHQDVTAQRIAALKQKHNITDIDESLIDVYNDQLVQIELLQRSVESFTAERKRGNDIEAKLKSAYEELDALKTEMKAAVEQLPALESRAADKETILNQHRKIQSLENIRRQLHPGEDCPLCGAPDGPLRHHEIPVTDQLEIDYKNARRAVDEWRTRISVLAESIRGREKASAELKEEADRLKSRLHDLLSEIESAKSNLKISGSLNDKSILTDKSRLIKESLSGIRDLLRLNNSSLELHELKTLSGEWSQWQDRTEALKKERAEIFPSDFIFSDWSSGMESRLAGIHKGLNGLMMQLSATGSLLDKNIQDLEKATDALNVFIRDNDLGDLAQLEALIRQGDELDTQQSVLTELRHDQISNDSLLNTFTELVRQYELENDTQVGLDDLISERDGKQQEASSISRDLGRISTQMELHRSNVEKGKVILEQLNALEEARKPVRTLKDLIGSADGKEFKKLAQKVTLSHLAHLANRHMEKMTDRYRFEFDTKELWSTRDADLMIHDAYDAQGLRSCTTLSGGETFIASLALALGLSDFASENARIESLFIDEGFGTLDPETLDMAVSALEKIQTDGNKILCLITHVEAMKERIPYHLVVEKGSRGVSTVRFEIS